MIYVWLGAFIPCIVFPFFRELAYSLWLLCSAQSRCVHPSVPPNVIKVMLDGILFGRFSSLATRILIEILEKFHKNSVVI